MPAVPPYFISVGEYQIPEGSRLGSHRFIEVTDSAGTIVYQFHGLATSADGSIQPIGIWPTDVLKYYAFDYQYMKMDPATRVFLQNLQSTTYNIAFSQADLTLLLIAIDAAGDKINLINKGNPLPYPSLGLGINSNSVWTTLLAAMGYSVPVIPNGAYIVPGVGIVLLDQATLEDIWNGQIDPPSGPSPNYAQLGQIFGSTLGRTFGGDNPELSLASGAILGAIAMNIGQMIETATNAGWSHTFNAALKFSDSTEEVWADFGPELGLMATSQAIGSVSSYLALELGEALGLEGFGAEMFSSVSGTILSHVATNLLATNVSAFSGLLSATAIDGIAQNGVFDGLGGALESSIISFFATKLGSMIVQPQTQAAVVLSSLGASLGGLGAVGTALHGGYLVNAIGSFAGSLNIPIIQGLLAGIPGAGVLIGFVLGALIGNMFGRKKPRIPAADAEVTLQLPNARYTLGVENQINNGNLNLVRSMAVGARDTLNGIIEIVTWGDETAKVSNTTSPTQVYGHTGGQLWVKLGGSGAAKTNVNSADEAVDKGVLWALPSTKIIGGDFIMKRAIYQLTRAPGLVKSVSELAGSFKIAEDYGFYLRNRERIEGEMAEPYLSMTSAQKTFYNANQSFMTRAFAMGSIPLSTSNAQLRPNGQTRTDAQWYLDNKPLVDAIVADLDLTQFAAAWIATLQRAAELELDRAAPSDFYGGAKGFIDGVSQTLVGTRVDYESVGFRMEGSDLVVRYAPERTSPNANLVPDGDVPGN
ncbi:MAG: hypothetical protein RIR33_1156, partial [Pseudomonadota bacterium]